MTDWLQPLGAVAGRLLACAWRGIFTVARPRGTRAQKDKRTRVALCPDARLHISLRVPRDLVIRLDAMAADVDRRRRRAGTLECWSDRYTRSDLMREILANAVIVYEAQASKGLLQ